MYFLIWIIVGLVTGWLTRKVLAEDGYGTIVSSIVAIGGALSGGLILRFTDTTAQNQLLLTTLAALVGAALFSGFTILIVGRERLI